jgi:hypothetical protein
LPEYGLHIDGGVRRDSIWPTILALKITQARAIPSIVLHYADVAQPEAYDVGTGVHVLFATLVHHLSIYFGDHSPESLLPLLAEQYATMLAFLKSQWQSITAFLPGVEFLDDTTMPKLLAARALGGPVDHSLRSFLSWGLTREMPPAIRQAFVPLSLIKHDAFLVLLEAQVGKTTYTLSTGVGSRPQPESQVSAWILEQKHLAKAGHLPQATFALRLEDFPKSASGFRHLTTARNIVYLSDSWSDVLSCLQTAYPRLAALRHYGAPDLPVMVYVSNSIKPGRIFGDPFTGQLTAYAYTFAKSGPGSLSRLVLAYFPHQVYAQLFSAEGRFRSNKGITLMRELVDVAVFHGGMAVLLNTGKVI